MSVLDGIIKIPNLVVRTKELGMNASTISDHGVCTGFIQHYKECQKHEIKPILGVELYLSVTDDHTLREVIPDEPKQQCYHLTALAKNKEGVRELFELSSRGWLEGYYYKPRVSLPMVEEIGKNLIILGACAKGPVSWNIKENRPEVAQNWLRRLREMFEGRFYLELMDHDMEWQKDLNKGLAEYSERFEVPWVPTNDCHFLTVEDHYLHSLMMCIQTKQTLETLTMAYPKNCYLRSPEEMIGIFGKEACKRTLEVAEQINIDLELNQTFFPVYSEDES
jgi:DNA polymerase-3 subunit alpha